MEVIVNGEARRVGEGVTLAGLIEELAVAQKVAACAVNMEVVKKEQWASYTLKAGDRIELLQFVGGG